MRQILFLAYEPANQSFTFSVCNGDATLVEVYSTQKMHSHAKPNYAMVVKVIIPEETIATDRFSEALRREGMEREPVTPLLS